MPGTAKLLEEMTDAGAFEILGLRVLRFRYEDCRGLVHLGVNADGKTIPSPIDAFQLLPNSQPHRYVMAAFTTAEDLGRKWLRDPSELANGRDEVPTDEGDLVKAAKQARMIRQADPDAQFTVYLCTNRELWPELMNKVYSKASELGVSAVPVDQSILRDFLDSTPEGHWLRQEHLGIAADIPSHELLCSLSRRSLERYRSDTQISSLDVVVETESAKRAAEALGEGSITLLLLTGPSGAGKSVTAQSAMARHIRTGNIALRISAEIAERASSMPDALTEVLQSLHGRFDSEVGRSALELATRDHPLLVVVDDINRTLQPMRLLEKVMGWARPAGTRESEAVGSSVRVVCPVWDSHSFSLQLEHKKTQWIRFQAVRSFLREESLEYFERAFENSKVRFGKERLGRFAEMLKDDPILLGMFAEIALQEDDLDPEAVARDTIGHYVKVSLGRLATYNHDPVGEYESALRFAARQLVLHKTLSPEWENLRNWVGSDAAALKKVSTSGRICQIGDNNGSERFVFRHDRIAEHFLAQAMVGILLESDDPVESLGDPYFVPYLGQAIASGRLPISKLDWLARKNPASLSASLRFLPSPSNLNVSEVTARARACLADSSSEQRASRNDALYLLAETNSPHVLTVTDGVAPYNPLLWEARLRNGDAVAGAHALSVDFYPSVNHAWLELLIRDAQEAHGPRLVAGVRTLLSSSAVTDRFLCGALGLAGYLADPSLSTSIAERWKTTPASDETLLCFLWAGLRCGGDAPQDLLEPMVESLMKVDDTKSSTQYSRRDNVLEPLSFSGRHGFPDSVLQYLTEVGADGDHEWVIAALVGKIDHPVAVRYMVKKIAKSLSELKPGSFLPFASHWRDWWRDRGGSEARLSTPSLDALRAIWTSPDGSRQLQEYAFQIWARYTTDIEGLRGVDTTSHFGATAIAERAIKGDSEVASALKEKLDSGNRAYWLQFVRYIWSPDFEEVLDGILEQLTAKSAQPRDPWCDDYHAVAHALRDIPVAPAERLLLKHWSKLSEIPLFIQAALYVSSNESRQKAGEALGRIDSNAKPFRFVDSFFGFNTLGLRDKIGVKHLESLRPYLSKIGGMAIHAMAEWCHRNGLRSWAIENLEPECTRRPTGREETDDLDSSMLDRTRIRWFPTDEDIMKQLDAIERSDNRHYLFRVEHLFDDLVELDQDQLRLFRLMEAWITLSPSGGRRDMALAALQVRGNRSALARFRTCFEASGIDLPNSALENVAYIIRRRTLE